MIAVAGVRTSRLTRNLLFGAAGAMLAVLAGCRGHEITGPRPRPLALPRTDVAPAPTMEFYFHAAPGNWQLFMGDMTVASLRSGRRIVMVTTTAGDGGNGTSFWQARETGALASVDAILGAGTWSCAPQTVNAHPIQRCTKGTAVVYFMRLPDGNPSDGQGYGVGSLSRLRDLGTPLSALDNSTQYVSWADLSTTIQTLITVESTGLSGSSVEVHTPDYDRSIDPADHPDYWATGDAVRAAIQGIGWTGAWYVGFHTLSLAPNLSDADTSVKHLVFNAYDHAMVAAGFASLANDATYNAWIQRTYFRISSTSPAAPTNLTAAASTRTRVDLSWTNNAASLNGFKVERAPNVAGQPGAFVQIAVVTGNTTLYSDVSAAPSTTYWYRVRAYGDGGSSAYSGMASATTPATTSLPYRGDVYVMAHQDDWQLFAGDRAYASFQSTSSMLFIFITAGDNGNTSAYWLQREQAALASVDAVMTAGPWACASKPITAGVYGPHSIQRCVKGYVTVYFMRMPDGNNIDGTGYGHGSISNMRDRGTTTAALDGSTVYNGWNDLTATLGAIIDLELDNQNTAPWVQVHTQDYSSTFNPGDHPDHLATGDAVNAAAANRKWDVYWYVGYDSKNRPANLADAPHQQKMTEYTAYDVSMVNAGYPATAIYPDYQAWLYRTYSRQTIPLSTTLRAPSNLVATPASTSEIDLAWTDNSTTESQFYIERAPDRNGSAGSYTVIDSVGHGAAAYANTGLAAGVTYWYRVRAIDPTGYSPYANGTSATTLPPSPPAAPSGLTLTAVDATDIKLTWVNNATTGPLSGFRIERAPNNAGTAGTYVEVATVGPTITSYTDDSLAALTTYWYRMRAYNTGGTSAYSNASSASTLTGMPAAPTNLKATPLSGSSIALDWTDNANTELGFQIEIAPDVNGQPGTFRWITGIAANSVTWTVTGLQPATTYWFRVAATYIDSAWSNNASAMTVPPAPAAPTNLTATPVTGGTEIDLAWTDNAAIETDYLVQRAPDNSGVAGTYTTVATLAPHATSYNDTGLNGSTRYWYRIRAENTGGSSAWLVTSATTLVVPPPAPPAAPSALTAQASAAQIALSWTNNATSGPLTGFRIERAPDNGGAAGTWTEITTVGAATTTYADTALQSLRTFWYRVRAYNGGGTSGYSNVVSATTPNNIPAAPTGLKATTLSQTQIALDWTNNATNALGIQLERAPDVNGAPGTFVWFAGIAANSVTYTVTGLQGGTTYWFRIRAATEIDSSAYSNNASATTSPANPAAPSNLVGNAVSGSEIDLTWTDNATNETSYTVQRAPDNNGVAGTYATVATLAAGATSYNNAPLAANTRYWYRVRANNSGGSSAWVVANATTLIAPPLAPSGLAAKATAAATTATLTWTDNSVDETGFRIEQAPDVGGVAGTYTEIATTGASVKTFTVSGLTGATKYWFRVRAYSAYGTSSYTNEASMTTPLPTNLSVASTTVSGVLTANLAWTPGAGPTVDVWRDATKIKSAVSNTGKTTDGARTAGVTNVYKVCNVGLTDAANCSNAVSITF